MKKWAMALVLGGCLSVCGAGAAFADAGGASDRAAIGMESQSLDPLMQKQQEIDRYVFEEHARDLESKGIMVTNTGVMGDYVEVGITPYNDENAAYLYEALGKQQVKIVEGIQAVTFGAGGVAADDTGAASDEVKPVMAEAAPLDTAALAEAGNTGEKSSTLWYVLGGAVLLLAAVLGAGKLRSRRTE